MLVVRDLDFDCERGGVMRKPEASADVVGSDE
jgi:hypothetical protein